MAELVIIIVVFAVIAIARAAAKPSFKTSGLGLGGQGFKLGMVSQTPGFARIVKRGVPARGIVLQVASTPSGSVGVSPWKCQMRQCTMDIEIPGQMPYVATVIPYVPTNLVRDMLPGATVELRIDPQRRDQIAIVGPGVGFNSALLNAGSQGQSS